MKFSIPVSKISKLEKIIARYQKKGANILFTKGEETVEDGTINYEDPRTHTMTSAPIKVRCITVDVEGHYIINGWRFLVTIEFTENGNIIRLADSSFESKVPAKYLHTPQICEHCGTIRRRKDTYLIYNDETNEFKQVGSTCLLEYTKGLDAEACAEIMSCLDRFVALSNKDCDFDGFTGNGYDSTGYGMSRSTVLPIAYAYVKQYGYERMFQGQGTANDVLMMIWGGLRDEELQRRYESLKTPTDDEMAAIDAYAEAIDDSQMGYMRNAKLAWLNKSLEYRDFGLICSFVNTYLKEQAKIKEQAARVAERNNTYVGNIGDRITLKVKSARVLYTKDNSWSSYYAGCSWVMEIVDTEGHTYKWSASTNNINEGDTITATVKDHSEYKGCLQTVITRGKITERAGA